MALISSDSIIPVLLCGGKGARLWPLSTSHLPKSFLALTGSQSLFENTLQRVSNASLFAAPVIVGHRDHAAMFLPYPAVTALLEPRAADTAAAIAVAVEYLMRYHAQDAVIAICPCDHDIKNQAAFESAIKSAARVARSGHLVLLGATPDVADTSYGYIHKGEALEGGFCVQHFTEKPDAATAQYCIKTGEYLFNCGIFVFSLRAMHHHLQAYHVALMDAAKKSVDGATMQNQCVELADGYGAQMFRSFDHEVVETYPDLTVIEAAMEWSDMGSYQRVWHQSDKDADGNVGLDAAYEATHNLVHSTVPTALIGVGNLVVAQNEQGLLIANMAYADQIKTLLPALAKAKISKRTQRPWGYFESVFSAPTVQVKSLMIEIGKRLSLQRHQHRSEHWVVISGVANVHKDGTDYVVHANESMFVPMGCVHRLANLGDEPLVVIEVQTGDYLGEDDIERFEDDFGRMESVA